MRRRATLRSQFVGAFASGAFLVLAWQPTHTRSVAAATDPVTIKGSGAQAVAPEMTPWGDTMAATDHPTNMQYIAAGSGDGLDQFKLQHLDYVISGVPYTDVQLAGLDLIRAPITVTAGVPLVTEPEKSGAGQPGWQTTKTVDHLGSEGGEWADCLDDPNDPDYDFALCEEVTQTPFTAPIRIPPQNFAAMFLDYPYVPGTTPYREWGQPDLVAALGGTLPDAWAANQAVPQVVNRTERAASNLYLQQYSKTMAPSIWDALKAATPGVKWDPPSQQFPVGTTRFGLETAIGVVAANGPIPNTASSPYNASHLVLVPAAWADATIAAYPQTQFRKIEIMNGAGEYVVATPASINAAVAAGGEQPLYATDHNVPGAYPITWVNYIYVPAHGLPIDKTNALAATIRFLATSGQNDAATLGDGHLTSAMAQQAIAAADSVVTSNCIGADRTVVDAPVGGWEPDLPEVDALGTVKRCEAFTAPPPTTTTTTTADVPTSTSTSTSTSTTVATSVTPVTTATPTTRAATTVATTATTEAASPDTTEVTQPPPEETSTAPPPATTTTKAPAVKLPLPVPSDGRGGFKSLATFVMGSGLFLVGRKIVAGIMAAL